MAIPQMTPEAERELREWVMSGVILEQSDDDTIADIDSIVATREWNAGVEAAAVICMTSSDRNIRDFGKGSCRAEECRLMAGCIRALKRPAGGGYIYGESSGGVYNG